MLRVQGKTFSGKPRLAQQSAIAARAIDVGLPPQVRERRMVVDALRRDPGQTIAAVHATGLAFAQRPAAVVEVDLRHRPEGELPNRSEQEGARNGGRGDPGAG